MMIATEIRRLAHLYGYGSVILFSDPIDIYCVRIVNNYCVI